jgi:hypothetical protein
LTENQASPKKKNNPRTKTNVNKNLGRESPRMNSLDGSPGMRFNNHAHSKLSGAERRKNMIIQVWFGFES